MEGITDRPSPETPLISEAVSISCFGMGTILLPEYA
jgi:hypothetical protein